MRITFLGTCSGTEPMPGRKHVAFTVEQDDGVYWFDAGEGSSYTAHLAGIDLLSVQAIFISHSHIDHIGGLPNLIFNMAKLNGRSPAKPAPLDGRVTPVLIPDRSAWDGVTKMLAPTASQVRANVRAEEYGDGEIFDDGVVRVCALHNHHVGAPAAGERWRSFSFRIEADDRVVVYSGDTGNVAELDPLLEGCDMLLMETGHHQVEDVCTFLKQCGKTPRQLVFVHHGRAVLADSEGEGRKAREILGDCVTIAEDGMRLEL